MTEGYCVISAEDFRAYMARAAAGESPDLLYAEFYANSRDVDDHEHEWTERRMTNGQPWWSCSCGEATDTQPSEDR